MSGPLIERIRGAVAANPAAPAFIFQDRVISQGQFLALIHATTKLLHERGVRPGDAVGLSMGRWPMHCVAMLALARLGAVSVPLAPRLSAAERAEVIARFGIRALVTNWDSEGIGLPIVVTLETMSAPEDEPEPDLGGFVPDESTPVRVALTSGTTGAKKGVLHTHGSFADRIDKTLHECDAATRLLPPDLHITVGMIFAIGVLSRGGTVVFDKTFVAKDMADTIRLYGVTHCLLSPATVPRMAAALPPRGAGLPSLRHLRIVGATPSPAMLEMLRTRFSPNVYVPYGLTELGVVSLATPETLAAWPQSAGRISPWARVEVVDGDGRVLPPGTTGEIRVAVDGMPDGYWREEAGEAQASKFRGGWFYPGDLGKVSPEGLLFIEGRTDDLVNFGGHKYSLGFIDAVLEEHPGVRTAVAFAIDAGNGELALGAAIAREPGTEAGDLARHLQERLGFGSPARFFEVDEIARDEMGKVNRAAIRSKAMGGPS